MGARSFTLYNANFGNQSKSSDDRQKALSASLTGRPKSTFQTHNLTLYDAFQSFLLESFQCVSQSHTKAAQSFYKGDQVL